MKTDRATEMLENARKQFQTNGAFWDDRTEAAVRSLIAAHLLEVEHLTMPAEVADRFRELTEDFLQNEEDPEGLADVHNAQRWVSARYDERTGEVLP